MFTASFNTKMDPIWWIVWFLHAGKEMVHARWSVARDAKKKYEFKNQAARFYGTLHSNWKNVQRDNCITEE